jgi:predicted transposase/invertase (TIGR01784 family)
MYIGRVYEKIVESDNIYSSSQIPIPRPEFIVLYNGRATYEEHKTIRLSSSYADKGEKPALELTVEVYNINEGHNAEILARSGTLGGYAAFIQAMREYEEKLGSVRRSKETMEAALRYCVEQGILRGFLKEHGSEVINMLMTRWNDEDAHRVWRQEGLREGIQLGRTEGIQLGRTEGIQLGRTEGIQEGLQQGMQKGLEQGMQEGIQQSKAEIARSLKSMGLPIEQIVQGTGLTAQQIQQL